MNFQLLAVWKKGDWKAAVKGFERALRLLEFSEAVGFAIGQPNLVFLSPAARQLMKGRNVHIRV
jgi:hypothetical protein